MLSTLRSANSGIDRTKGIVMTKEQWEAVVLEMPEYVYVDPVMYQKCADKLGMAYQTFWKWYNVWYASGKNTKALPFIKTQAEIDNDKRRNRETSERVSDLPKIQWRK
ncbi:MAG: hypothetical protein J6S67_09460 [Methanobrevibacter sp.]|nr:hypothetical protein [Methanobrevibacter sp.]